MNGASSRVSLDFSLLKSYFDRLSNKLKNPMLVTENEEINARGQCLIAKQKTIFEKCNYILRKFFLAPGVETQEIVAENSQEVAALNLILRWFMSEQGKIEKNLAGIVSELVSLKLINNVDFGRFFVVEEVEDASLLQDSAAVGQETSACKGKTKISPEGHKDDNLSDHARSNIAKMEEVKEKLQKLNEKFCHNLLLRYVKNRMDKPKLEHYTRNDNDRGKLHMILCRSRWLEDRTVPSVMDLFFVLRRFCKKIIPVTWFKSSCESALKGDDQPRFITKIFELLELADEELRFGSQWWNIHDIEEDRYNFGPRMGNFMVAPELGVKLNDVIRANDMFRQLMGLVWRLGNLRRYRALPESRPEEFASLEKDLEDMEAELKKIEVEVDPLKAKVEVGLFVQVTVALGEAIYCIESMKV